jgi:pantetheine-phosphate adenylyltransferase
MTKGHESVIRRALPLFDRIIVAIGENEGKKPFFTLGRRIFWLGMIFDGVPGIEVATYPGLTIDFCRERGARFILRGLRTSADFEFERSIGQVNKMLYPDIETVFLLGSPEYASVSSSIVREIIRHGGDAKQFVPDVVDLKNEL